MMRIINRRPSSSLVCEDGFETRFKGLFVARFEAPD
jgi:hypothetical protein